MLAVLAAALLAAPSSPTPAEERALAAVTEAALRADVRFLASDLLEGRGPGTRGGHLAENYLAAQLQALGYQGAAPEGGFLQRVPLVSLEVQAPPRVEFAAPRRRLVLKFLDDIVVGPGVQAARAGVKDAEVVFVGYGITAPEYGWDDFKGTSMKGKVLLVMNNDPEDDPALFEGKRRTYYGRWSYKYEEAARQGAAGVIIIHTTPSAAYPWTVVQTSWTKRLSELPAGTEPRIQVRAWATEEASRRIAALGGQDLDALRAAAQRKDFRPVPLGVKLSLQLRVQVEQTWSANVLGSLPGRDPALSGQAVMFTAHHDHLGVNPGARPGQDAVYNGAVDNATGCAAILAVARAWQALPGPGRRTVLFAFVAAEEQGLLGSEWLAAHPPVPTARIAAVLNLDALKPVGRARDVRQGGRGKTSLDAVVDEVAGMQGRVVKGDPFPERGSFYRSDHFSFAKAGVPAIDFGSGLDCLDRAPAECLAAEADFLARRYHQPSDEYRDDWNVSGMVEDARLVFLVGRRIADADALPGWAPGDEFEAARKRDLASRASP